MFNKIPVKDCPRKSETIAEGKQDCVVPHRPPVILVVRRGDLAEGDEVAVLIPCLCKRDLVNVIPEVAEVMLLIVGEEVVDTGRFHGAVPDAGEVPVDKVFNFHVQTILFERMLFVTVFYMIHSTIGFHRYIDRE